ncbi:hypothetical protein [Candidatus Similichlamydia laticola]|uniref:Uncharacterized protein n=1 Tax=Candidatus Similichlamydia laticola TaxID=2170265 RepID=A0A369KIA7_9BACT|nr:hypothetical protein [Candidatus Similichlamydia laticola]RDB31523.1 hypothetical protein HAT2_00397 [Candidatus Similichlamydia laticola]
MSDDADAEDLIPPDHAKRNAIAIGLGCGVVTAFFLLFLFQFYGKQALYLGGCVLTTPERLHQVRASYVSVETGTKEKWILNKIEFSCDNLEEGAYTRNLLPEEYSELFLLVKEENPLSDRFANTMVWEETAVSVRLYVSSSDQVDKSPLVYQQIDFSPDGALFRVSLPLTSLQARPKWVYYHCPGILKLVKKKFAFR